MSIPARLHSSATMATGWTPYPSSRIRAKSDSRESHWRRRSAVIIAALLLLHWPADAGPVVLSQAGSGRRDLRSVHGQPAVLPQPADRHHAGAPGDGDHRLRPDLRDSVR